MPDNFPRQLLSSRQTRIALSVLGALLFVFLLFDFIFMPLYTRQGSEQPVPKLIGLSREQAHSVAESVGFTVEEGTSKIGGNVPEGTILEQRPEPGALAKPGRKIHVIPAMAAPPDAAPDVTGLDLRDAQLRCRNAGLISSESDITYRFSERSPKGTVVGQDPSPGKKVGRGATVKLVVSLGPQPQNFYVPYLMEKSLSDAIAALREAGLKLGKISRKETDTYPSGTVIAQSIRSGDEVERNTAVDIVVAVRPGMAPAQKADTTQSKLQDRPKR